MVKLKRVYESDKDKADLKAHLGDDLYNDYMKIRDRIPKDQNDYKDFQKLKKLPIEDVQNFVDNFQSESDRRKEAKKGAKKIYSDSDWDVYKITTYPAAQLYGSGTKWCITGRYPGHEGRGEKYFNEYIENNNLDGGYYFFLDKHNNGRKYCVLRTKNGYIHSIWIPEDSEIRDVDPYDVPGDLPNDIQYNGFNLGEEIQEYVENNGGSGYDPIEGLANALSVDPENMDLERIEELADRAGDYGLEDFDYFYDCLAHGSNKLDDSKVEAFKILLNEEVPSKEWIREHLIEEKCFESLIDTIIDNTSLYNSLFFETLFVEIVNNYGKNESDYSCVQDLGIVLSILENCFDTTLGDAVDFESVVNSFNDKIILDPEFLTTCLNHGMGLEDFIDFMDDTDENEDLRIPLLKVLVEHGLIDLNGILTKEYHKPTIFMVALGWDPSVEDVKWMLAHGANPDLKDGDGDTAIEWTADSKIKNLFK